MTFGDSLGLLLRFLALDDAAVLEIRDDRSLTVPALVGALIAVFLSAMGAWLYGEFTLDFTPDGWFSDTVFFGTIFTVSLFVAGMSVTYIFLTQVFRQGIEPEALARVLAVAHIPYALGVLVFIDEVGFLFGVMSVVLMFLYAFHALKTALPNSPARTIMLSVIAGFSVWLGILPIVSGIEDPYVTGVFVYSLIA